ncbi:hypothetical protein BH10PSE17_BH10PSE17_33730 [soil metagenome]
MSETIPGVNAFVDIVNGAPAPALIVNLRTRHVINVNQACAVLTGGDLAPAHDWAVDLDIDNGTATALVAGNFHDGKLGADHDSGLGVIWLERPPEDAEGRLTQASRRAARLENRLTMAIEFAQLGFYETELQSGINHWDEQCFRLFDLEPDSSEPGTEAMLAMLHPDDRVIVGTAWEEARHQGRPGSVRFRLVRGSAETRVIQTQWRVETDPNGLPVRAFGVMADITPTYRAAQRELELNNRLGLAASVGGVGSWAWELDENIVYFDERLYDIMGLAPSQQHMSMDQMRDLVIEEDRDSLERATARVLREHGEVQSEYRIRRGDGDLRHHLTRRTAQRNEFGVPVRIVAVVIDITDTKRREAQIAELAARLEFATDAGGIGVWDWDLRAGVVFYSSQYRALVGYDEIEWPDLAGTWERHLHRDDGPLTVKAMEDYVEGRSSFYSSEHRLLCKDGRWRWFLDRGAIVERDAVTGAPLRMVGTLIDLTERKQTEIALREAQARMELATIANGFGIYEYDYSTRVFTFDAQTARIYGLAAGETLIAHDKWVGLLHPDDRERVDAEVARRRRVGHGSQLEFRVRAGTDRTRWLFTSFVTRERDDGTGASMIGTVVDVSQRHDAERAARIASERLAVATQAAGIGIWERDLATGESIWNDEMYRLFGCTSDETRTPRQILADNVLPSDTAEVESRLAACARTGRPYVFEYRIRRVDGAERWIAARGTLKQNADGTAERILGVNWDVTESRAAQAAASDTAERLRLATSATGIGIWSRDFGRDEVFWNDQLFRLFGHEPKTDRSPRSIWTSSVPEVDRQRVRGRHQQALRDGQPYSYEFTAFWPDGSERRIAARGIVQKTVEGRDDIRLIGVNWDVTEQKRAEQALLAKEAAEQASRAKSEFLSRMSHELRTPLNAILGFAQLLQLDTSSRLDTDQRARVDRIQTAGWHLLELINEVLDLSRIEAGAVKLASEPIAIAELVSECVDLILPQAQTGGLALALDTLSGELVEVVADRTRLKQVLLNLLSNAVKYNFAGGSITVGVERPHDDGHAVISVRDTGRGMTRDQLDRLYEPFDRLGIDTTSIEGTCIGLAISRRLVELMGGTIDVNSEPGVGSEFRVRLPLAEDVASPMTRTQITATMPPPVRVEEDARGVGTVLYIEDNPLNRLLIEQYLHLRPGLTLVQAEDGLSGVLLARALQPDLTIVDINLPDIDGFEVLRQLRDDPLTRPLRCVALSANAMPQDIGRALQAGFSEYWTKPIAIDDFLTKVDACMARV